MSHITSKKKKRKKRQKEMRAVIELFTLSALVIGVEAPVAAVADAACLTGGEKREATTFRHHIRLSPW